MMLNKKIYPVCPSCGANSIVEIGSHAPDTELNPLWTCGACGSTFEVNPSEFASDIEEKTSVPVKQEVVVKDETQVDVPSASTPLTEEKPVRTFSKPVAKKK